MSFRKHPIIERKIVVIKLILTHLVCSYISHVHGTTRRSFPTEYQFYLCAKHFYRYVYTFGTDTCLFEAGSFPTDKMLRHRHLPLRGRVVPYGISILFVRLIIVLGDDSTKGFPLRGSWRGTRLMRCSRPQTALSFHTHKVTVS